VQPHEGRRSERTAARSADHKDDLSEVLGKRAIRRGDGEGVLGGPGADSLPALRPLPGLHEQAHCIPRGNHRIHTMVIGRARWRPQWASAGSGGESLVARLLVNPGVAVALPVEELLRLEEEGRLTRAAVDTVTGVDQVLAALEGKVPADAARSRLGGVG
jgi:hypothetical protein